MTKNTVLFIVANEATNAGERDYMLALSAALQDNKKRNTDYLVYKIPTGKDVADNAQSVVANPRILPINNAQYAAVPTISDDALKTIPGFTQVIGVGHSTSETLVKAIETLRKNNIAVQSSFIAHLIKNPATLNALVRKGTTIFTPANAPKAVESEDGKDMWDAENMSLEEIESLYDFEARGQYVKLDAVPHTNTLALSQIEYMNFMKTDNGNAVEMILGNDLKLAFVVLNAGFEDKAQNFTPYTDAEATEHGKLLGQLMPKGTTILIAHGGPRNLRDEKDGNQRPLKAFGVAYTIAQGLDETGGVYVERFEPGLPYNVVKAGYIIAQNKNCLAYISNAEGYGTMDGAVLNVNNQEKLVAMFPFNALQIDQARIDNIEKYNKKGIAILRQGENGPKIDRHPQEQQTPYQMRDAAEQIIDALDLGKEKLAPAVKSDSAFKLNI